MSTPEPAEHDLDCYRGVDFEFTFSMTEDDINVDFTDAAVWLVVYGDQVKTLDPVLILATDSGEITIENGGFQISARYPAAETEQLETDQHIYDLDVGFSNGKRWRIFTGRFIVHPGNLA
ncbi:MAG: hypothetical protein ABJN40_13215 [Sneathiella sp.]